MILNFAAAFPSALADEFDSIVKTLEMAKAQGFLKASELIPPRDTGRLERARRREGLSEKKVVKDVFGG